jgi:hypothetical protein
MAKIKLEDIIFWILIFAIIGTAIWLLSGSPTDTSAIIAIAVFVAASEILIWKNLFKIEKKTLVGFEKVKSEIKLTKKDLDYQLNEIKSLIKK